MVKYKDIQDSIDLNTPAKRLKHLRNLTRNKRPFFEEKYSIPIVTLKSWENGTTKISVTTAKKLVDIYLNEGLIVSEDWIINGSGLGPKNVSDVGKYFTDPNLEITESENEEEISMIKDANIFKNSHNNAVIMMVSNDEMLPFYRAGDYVGGKLRLKNKIDTALNQDCIIYLKNGERFFRRLVKDYHGRYNLLCLNPTINTAEPVLFNVEIESVAPVIWYRRKDLM